MRSPQDPCLLCNANLADKTNSHIIPKFMTKSLLMHMGKAKGYRYSSDKVDKKTNVVQSSDTENYILCNECETYFSVLETLVANRIHMPIADRLRSHLFTWGALNNANYCEINNLNGLAIRLFISSLIWRCAISTSHVAQRYDLADDAKEDLRVLLLEFKCSTQADFLAKVENEVRLFPFQFDLTTVVERNRTKGKLVFLHPNSRTEGFFILNEYILTYNFGTKEGNFFGGLLNNVTSNANVRIKVANIVDWNYFCNVYMVEKFAGKAINFLRRTGKQYIPFKR